MASVVVLDQAPREGGLVEVTLSKDGSRFTVTVPQSVADLPESYALYEIMAAKVSQRQARVAEIVDLIRKT